MLALVLLFARPFLKPQGAGASAEAARRVVLVLDASLSMRAVQKPFEHRQNKGSRLAGACLSKS